MDPNELSDIKGKKYVAMDMYMYLLGRNVGERKKLVDRFKILKKSAIFYKLINYNIFFLWNQNKYIYYYAFVPNTNLVSKKYLIRVYIFLFKTSNTVLGPSWAPLLPSLLQNRESFTVLSKICLYSRFCFNCIRH